MGYGLAEEVAAARPVRPGPEWWTLLDLAQSASDETRRAWPGEDYLLERAGCSRATLYRRLAELEKAGLLKVIKTGRNHRTEYEVPPMPGSATERLAAGLVSQDAETPSPVDNPVGVSCYSPVGVSKTEFGVSKTADGVSGMRETPPVSTSVTLPSTTKGSVVGGSVEGRARGPGQDHRQSPLMAVTGEPVPIPEQIRCRQCGGRDEPEQIKRAAGLCQWCAAEAMRETA